jgi:hypothetical protein
VPTINKCNGGCVFWERWKHLEYRVKANALSKPKNIHLSTTLALQLVQKSEHKHKKEKTPPLEIHNEFQEDFIVVCKKHLTKHGGQVVKQVSKPERILERIILPKPIIRTNCNMVVLNHTFSIWIYNIVMFP